MALDYTINRLYRLRLRDLWPYFTRESPSFWLVSFYMFVEYVRPQQIYAPLAGLPLAALPLLLGAAAFLLEAKRVQRRWKFVDTLVALFFGVLLLSSILAIEPSVSRRYADAAASLVLAYFLISSVVTTESRLLVFVLAFLLYNAKMSQNALRTWAARGFTFERWGVACSPGWLHNSGECGMQMLVFICMSMFFILALRGYWPRWKTLLLTLMPLSAIGVVAATSSRGAVVGLGVVALWLIVLSKKRGKALVALTVATVAFLLILPPEQKARFTTMGDDDTSVSRLTHWGHALDAIEARPSFGIGYSNWMYYYRNVLENPRPEMVHNTFLEAGAELGITGLFVFFLLIGHAIYLGRATRRKAATLGSSGRFFFYTAMGLEGSLISFLATGFFISALYYPLFWVNLALIVATNIAVEARLVRSREVRAAPGRAGRTGRGAVRLRGPQ